MDSDREGLVVQLKDHYRSHGWRVDAEDDGTLRAAGPGGVTWHGATVTAEDLESGEIEDRLVELADRRMPQGGELCPLDLLAESKCEDELRQKLDELGLSRRPHVSVYSAAA